MRRWTASIFALLVLAGAVSAAAAAEKTLAPGENLIVEGVPAIPTSLVAQVGRYSEFRSARLVSLHPVRREMLISTRFADTWQIHRVTQPGGDRTQLTFFPDNVFGAEYEPTHGESFLFSKDEGGNE